MIRSSKPIISVGAVRTGSGKSQTSRRIIEILMENGLKVVAIRHLMPYGDLVARRVQRYAELSERDIWEIYSLRTILEEEAIRLATRQGNAEDIAALQEILDAMFQAAEVGDQALVQDLDLRFHQQMWKMAGHSRLESFLKEVAVQAKMYIAVQTSLYDDLAAGVSDHATILEHLKSGNEQEAVDTMRNHLQEAEATVRAYFMEKQSQEDLLNKDME